MIPASKVCSRCRECKPATDYWLREGRLQSARKVCMSRRSRATYAERYGRTIVKQAEPTPIEQAELWAAFRSWRLRGCVHQLGPSFGVVCDVRYRPTPRGVAMLKAA
jgi:hypothetical protein